MASAESLPSWCQCRVRSHVACCVGVAKDDGCTYGAAKLRLRWSAVYVKAGMPSTSLQYPSCAAADERGESVSLTLSPMVRLLEPACTRRRSRAAAGTPTPASPRGVAPGPGAAPSGWAMCRGTGLLGLRSQALQKPPSPRGCERGRAHKFDTCQHPWNCHLCTRQYARVITNRWRLVRCNTTKMPLQERGCTLRGCPLAAGPSVNRLGVCCTCALVFAGRPPPQRVHSRDLRGVDIT